MASPTPAMMSLPKLPSSVNISILTPFALLRHLLVPKILRVVPYCTSQIIFQNIDQKGGGYTISDCSKVLILPLLKWWDFHLSIAIISDSLEIHFLNR